MHTNWWIIIGGGLIGAFVVFISLTSAPILGVSTFFAALFLGQLISINNYRSLWNSRFANQSNRYK